MVCPDHTLTYTMSALVDELSADFADLDDEEQEYENEGNDASVAQNTTADAEGDEEMSEGEAENTDTTHLLDDKGVMTGGMQPAEQLDPEAVQRMELGGVADVSKVAKLYGSKRMNDVIKVAPFSLLKTFAEGGNRKSIPIHHNRVL